MHMQTLLTFLPVAQTTPSGNPVNAIMEKLRPQMDPGTVLLAFVIGQIALIIGILIASKAVVSEQYRDTLGNALRVWLGQWLLLILSVVAGFVILFGLSAANALQFAGVVILLIVLITLIMMIRIPMGTYQIGVVRAIGLMIIAWVVAMIGNVATSFFIGSPPKEQWALAQQIWNLTPEQREQLNQAIRLDRQAAVIGGQELPGEKEARDTSKPLQDRADALKEMYAELEKRRQAVAPGDEAAKAAYERQKARYEALLDQLKAEAKAQGTSGTQQ